MNDKEKEQAREGNGGKPDFNFKAKFVLTMLNNTIYKHMLVPDGCAGQQSNESLKACYAHCFSKHQFAFHLKLSLMTLKCW